MSSNPDCLVYNCHLFGGPNDGEVSTCFRPYFQLGLPTGTYRTQSDDPEVYVQWEDDGTRRIDLYYVAAKAAEEKR